MNDIDVADEILENCNNIVTAECENLFDINKILLTNENAQNMTILHYNIRSLRANFDELCINVNKFNERRNIVAIILSETWYIDDISYFNIDGFTVYYNGASFNKCDGVVSMLECNIELDKYNLNIIGVYRPNPTNTQVFIEDMDDYLTKLIKNDISVIIGDVNIDINHNNKLSTESLAYTNMLSKNGFVQQISVPTRVDGDSATTIDHIATFVNNISKSKVKFNSLVLHNSLTDHYPLFYNIEFSEQKPKTLRTARHIKIKQFDEVGFLNEIKTINWDALYSCQDPQVATDMFFENFNKMAERHTLEVKINNKKYKIKPWMTSGLLTSIRRRDSLKKEVLKEKNNIQLKQTFKSYRNFVSNLIKITKNNYYLNKKETKDTTPPNKWKLKNADWMKYSRYIEDNIYNIDLTENINIIIEKLNKLITDAAQLHIGKTKVIKKKNPVPWWNQECEDALKESKKAMNKFKRHKIPENLCDLRQKQAKARLGIRLRLVSSVVEIASETTKLV
nr:unnamed protein product [Callosobruchus chinensis]